MTLTRKTTQRTHRPTRRGTRTRARAVFDTRQAIKRIDTMVRELETLRRQLTTTPKAGAVSGLTEELFGAAGRGTRDEYDLNLDWVRFSEWQTR